VQAQHLEDDVFAHRVGHVGVDEADDRDISRQGGIAQQMVDPGAQPDDQLQVRQRAEKPRFGLPDQRIFDRRLVADFRPVADFMLRHQFAEQRRQRAPRQGRTEQDRHRAAPPGLRHRSWRGACPVQATEGRSMV
jgi:hypothetical protein